MSTSAAMSVTTSASSTSLPVGQTTSPACPPPQETSCLDGPKNCCMNIIDNWRAIPALVCLVVSIMGVVMSLICQQPYLAIPFGVGALCSMYLLNLASDFIELGNFKESNKEYREHNATYGELNTRMSTYIGNFQAENANLSRQVLSLTVANQQNQATADRLKVTEEKLRTTETFLAEATRANQALVGSLQAAAAAVNNNVLLTATEREKAQKLVEETAKVTGDLSGSAANVRELGATLTTVIGDLNKAVSATDSERRATLADFRRDCEEMREMMTKVRDAHAAEELAWVKRLGDHDRELTRMTGERKRLEAVNATLEARQADLSNSITRLQATEQGLGKSVKKLNSTVSGIARDRRRTADAIKGVLRVASGSVSPGHSSPRSSSPSSTSPHSSSPRSASPTSASPSSKPSSRPPSPPPITSSPKAVPETIVNKAASVDTSASTTATTVTPASA